LGIKPELFARQEEDKITLPPAGYTLTNAKKDIFCETLSNIRSHANAKRIRKEISLQELDKLQLELVVTLFLLEKFFPLNRPEGCIAEETIMEETIKFFSEYHKTMKTIGILPDKHVTNENKDGKPLSAGKSSEFFGDVFQKAHFNVIQNTDEIVPYIERHKQVERELAISKDSVSETVRWISYGPRATIVKYEAYNINGYTFRTKSNDGIVFLNSGVSVEAVDLHISKEVATTRKAFYYGVLQEIWVLDYRFRQIPLFKCDWVNHKAGGVKHDPNLGYTLVDLNSLGHKDDPFILASQARQVFYVKDQIDKKLSIVFRTPTKNYKDTYDEVDEEFSTVIHEHNDNILPRVNRRDLGNESQNDYYRTDCEEPI
ncbi:putative transposon, En/Spm-like protein, partial [Tanacetum coccineum]